MGRDMSKKEREAWYVEQLRELWSDFPAGPRTSSENPDCLVRGTEHTVGIEVTEFTLPPDDGRQPTRETLSVRARIVRTALDKYRADGGPVLIVDIEFDPDVRLTKSDVVRVADAIAERLLAHTFAKDESPGWYQAVSGDMPHGVLGLTGGRYQSAESWDGDSIGVARECSVDSVQQVIDRKAARYQAYRSRCDAVVLLIVFSAVHDPQTAIPRSVLENAYVSPFDWTIALLADEPEAVLLNTVKPDA